MKKLMLVDDVEIANFIMKMMIQKVAPDSEVTDFTLPAEALKNLEQAEPDVIFLDINMPEINGWKFLETMRERDNATPVYILSSSTSELDFQQARSYTNVIQFLIKPLTIEALGKVLARIQPGITVADL